MTRIGIISDTHGHIHPKIYEFFAAVDEIWHAGDIGNIKTADILAEFKPLRAVYGNIDGQDVRSSYPLVQLFIKEEVKILMTHIGGTAGQYTSEVKKLIQKECPQIFVCGHSHILKIKYQTKEKLLHLNPGAAGISGFHQVITMLRFEIDGKEIKNMEIMELPRSSRIID
ncbi:MAG: metallophosphoesterase family protein [Bacteroidetes bacterium]|nr:metallophosphoesterase family protein [Bacteroidota bacterium]